MQTLSCKKFSLEKKKGAFCEKKINYSICYTGFLLQVGRKTAVLCIAGNIHSKQQSQTAFDENNIKKTYSTREDTQRARQVPNTALDSQAYASIHLVFGKSHFEAGLSDNRLENIHCLFFETVCHLDILNKFISRPQPSELHQPL